MTMLGCFRADAEPELTIMQVPFIWGITWQAQSPPL